MSMGQYGYALCITMTDVSAPSSVYIAVPRAAKVVKVQTVLQGAITVANSTVTIKKKGGSTFTNGTITVAYTGSAAGDIDTCEPSAGNYLSEDDVIQIDSDGGSTTTAALHIVISLK